MKFNWFYWENDFADYDKIDWFAVWDLSTTIMRYELWSSWMSILAGNVYICITWSHVGFTFDKEWGYINDWWIFYLYSSCQSQVNALSNMRAHLHLNSCVQSTTPHYQAVLDMRPHRSTVCSEPPSSIWYFSTAMECLIIVMVNSGKRPIVVFPQQITGSAIKSRQLKVIVGFCTTNSERTVVHIIPGAICWI